MVMQLGTGLILVTLGYLAGKNGEKIMVCCPATQDGQLAPGALGLESPNSPASFAGLTIPQTIMTLERAAERLGTLLPRSASTTYYLERLADAGLAQKVLFILTSTLNQAVNVQLIGNESNSPTDEAGRLNIGATQSLPATNGKIGIGVDLTTDWYPWMGVVIQTTASAPTSGQVDIRVVMQRWALNTPKGAI